MLSTLIPISLKSLVFNPTPHLAGVFIPRYGEIHFRPQIEAGKEFLSGTIWGSERPINLRLYPTLEDVVGALKNVDPGKSAEIPMRTDNRPQWVAAYNLTTYTALVVPLRSEVPQPPDMEVINRDTVFSQAELQEAQAQYLEDHFLIFVDTVPRHTPPPQQENQESGTTNLMGALHRRRA